MSPDSIPSAADRIKMALDLARQGDFASARNTLHIVEMGRRASEDQMTRAWATFGKIWRRAA